VEAYLLEQNRVTKVATKVEIVHPQLSDVGRLIDIFLVDLEVNVRADLAEWCAEGPMCDKVAGISKELSIHGNATKRPESLHRLFAEEPIQIVEVELGIVQIQDDE